MEFVVSRTDVHRPFRVKMLSSKSNFKEVHNHGSRPLLKDGKRVYVEVEGKTFNGRPVKRLVLVDFHECDLPADPWAKDDREFQYSMCHYTYTWSWINSGDARCGCPMCSDSVGRKLERRKDRRMAQAEVRKYHPEDY